MQKTATISTASMMPARRAARTPAWLAGPLGSRPLRLAVKIIGDAILLTLAYHAAFALRFGDIPARYQTLMAYSGPLVVLTKLILLHNFHLYRYPWRFTGVSELVGLVKAISLASLFILADYALASEMVSFPRSTILFDWFLSVALLSSFRLALRLAHDRRSPAAGARLPIFARRQPPAAPHNVLLYGAGDFGASLVEQIQRRYGSAKRIIGFIDDDPGLRHMRVHGVEVLGGRDVLPVIAKRQQIHEIIVAISAISGKGLSEIVAACREVSGNVQVAPGLDEIFQGKVNVSDLREVRIEDLLGRASEKVNLDEDQLHRFLGGQTVLVTGAGGSIGSELCFQILKFNPRRLVLFGRGENSIYASKQRLLAHANGTHLDEVIGDIINFSKIDHVLATYRPDLIFHAAADKHVPLMELHPDEAVLNNIIGTRNVLRAAEKHAVKKVVCISSDKAVNPTNVMGCCKRVTELLVQRHGGRRGRTVSCAVRFGNVLGSRGSVIPMFKRQIAEGGPITVTDENITRYFMTIPEAVLLVLQAGALASGGEIFLLEMGKPMRIIDLARQMIRLSGLREESVPIKIVGLRPGEKMTEELAFPYERLAGTAFPKLYVLQGGAPPHPDLEAAVDRLKELGITMDFDGIIETLQALVPEYNPSRPVRAAVAQATAH
jgi:FlaA1/EpsC-like NDP-sugar epimerase